MNGDDDRKRIYNQARDFAIARAEHETMEELRELVTFRGTPEEEEANHLKMVEVIEKGVQRIKRLEAGRPE